MEKEANFPSPDESAIHDKVTKKRERGLALPLSRTRVFVVDVDCIIIKNYYCKFTKRSAKYSSSTRNDGEAKLVVVVVVVSLTHFVFIDFRHRVEDGHETDEAHRHNENHHWGDFQTRRIVRVKLEDGIVRAAASRGDVGPRPGAWSFA